MTEPKTRDQLEKEWWDAWWAADYSWEGLAKKPVGQNRHTIHGGLHGEQTLQDYWRRDPATGAVRDDATLRATGELVEFEGTTFHIAHVPVKSRGGGVTWKADLGHPEWAGLDTMFRVRLATAADTRTDALGYAVAPDGRAQFAGAVLRGMVLRPTDIEAPLTICCHATALLGVTDWSKTQFGIGTDFSSTLFADKVVFSGARFSGFVSFNRAIFFDKAEFGFSRFTAPAYFLDVVFCGYADFYGASFKSDAVFRSAKFVEKAMFHSANISIAAFDFSVFSAAVSFEKATFGGAATFLGASFEADAEFLDAKFSADTTFNGARFHRGARFRRSGFANGADFAGTKFLGDASFQRGNSGKSGEMRFDHAEFQQQAYFKAWQFGGSTHFDGAHFVDDVDFSAATFDGLASFERILWPKDARHWHSAFDQTLFRATASFTGAGFLSYAAFDGATFERGMQIDDATERASKQQFLMEKKAAIGAAAADGATFEVEERKKRERMRDSVTRAEVAGHVRRQREERLKQLERGCRVLKQAMERASNKSREQLLYRFELQARRAQKGLPPGEALFSDLYGATSDYGASMVRPFLSLAFLVVAFAALFLGWAFALGLVGRGALATDVWHALDLSWANVFKPLSALSGEAVKEGTLGHALLNDRPGVSFAVRAVSTLQSLLAIVLAFLFALAVRRRFQIS